MGYYVNYEFENVRIKKEKEDECLQAINNLFKNNESYSWVDKPYQDGYEDLRDAIESWRFGISRDEEFIYLDEFSGEKLGNENVLFETLAPFVEPNGFIYGRGKDGDLWRFSFINGTVKEQRANITYE